LPADPALPATAPPRPPLLPYTTLFRSPHPRRPCGARGGVRGRARARGRRRGRGGPRLGRGGDREIAAGGDRGGRSAGARVPGSRSEEHTSELQSRENVVCRLLLETNTP